MVLQQGTTGERFQSIFIPREADSQIFALILAFPTFARDSDFVNNLLGGVA